MNTVEPFELRTLVFVPIHYFRVLYHDAWAITMVTFHVPQGDICPVDKEI